MDRTRVLALGGCLLHGPINCLARARPDFFRVRLNASQSFPVAYTFGEMLQQIALFRGTVSVPREIVPLLGFSAEGSLTPDLARFDEADLVLVEPNSPSEILFEGYHLHRGSVVETISRAINDARQGDERDRRSVEKAVSGWLNRGVLGFDPEVQAKRATVLKSLMPSGMANGDMVRAVIAGVQGVQRDPAEGLRAIRAAIAQPMALVTFTFQYMPDGRPVHWPPNFRERTLGAAQKLRLPIFEPWRVVQAHGVDAAMKPDLRHYRDDFAFTMGQAIEPFIAGLVAAERRRRQIGPLRAGADKARERLLRWIEAVPANLMRERRIGAKNNGLRLPAD